MRRDLTDIRGIDSTSFPAAHFREQADICDDYKRMAETFNSIGEAANRNGVKFGYHNHFYAFSPLKVKFPLK